MSVTWKPSFLPRPMRTEILKPDPDREYATPERCRILELANDAGDEAVSIARASVEPGVTTAWHRLEGIAERYLIVSGVGRVELGGGVPEAVQVGPSLVGPGDVVRIPPGVAQRIANVGVEPLVFYCICSPRFDVACYVNLETEAR